MYGFERQGERFALAREDVVVGDWGIELIPTFLGAVVVVGDPDTGPAVARSRHEPVVEATPRLGARRQAIGPGVGVALGAGQETPVVGAKLLAERAKAAGVETVVFDRGGYQYHGRVKALAEGIREGGLAL